jgi:2-furoyl-CoA dehydrogenase large subunit
MNEYKWIGKPIKIKDDYYPVTGKATYLDDIELPNTAYVAFLRSPYGHAKIKKIDYSKALQRKGVIYVLTGKELPNYLSPYPQIPKPPAGNLVDYPMAVEKVRYYGEPVVAVVAEDKYTAEDALEDIDIEYEVLKPVLDVEEAVKNEILVHEEIGTNIIWIGEWNYGDVEKALKEADLVIEDKFIFHRYTSAPLETAGAMAVYDGINDVYTIYSNNIMPMFTLPLICTALRVPPSKVRMITPPNIGGSFGTKIINYTYMTVLALLARLLKRPIKYVETRTENITNGGHSNGRTFYVKVGVKKDGEITGISVTAYDDIGAYPRYEPAGAVVWSQVLHGMYRVKNIKITFYSVLTNKPPTSPVRGYSRIQHNFMWERLMDRIAKKLGLDPVEVRLKNYIRPEEMPYEGPSGVIYDGGNYIEALKLLLKYLEYDKWRELQKEYRKQGRYIGIGISGVIDSGANNFAQVKMINKDFPVSGNSEAALIMVDPGGDIIVRVGTTDSGQSHDTTFSQVVAEILGVNPEDIKIIRGFDSWSNVWAIHSGSYASRNAVMATGALIGAARRLKEKILKIASFLLKEDESNLDINNGVIVSKVTGRSISLRDLATIAWTDVNLLPGDIEPGLVSFYIYRPDFRRNLPDENKRINNTLTYSYELHGVVIEVDKDTGMVKILKQVVIGDPGIMINPLVVEGQEIGAAMHGNEAALNFRVYYDENGAILNPNFLNYTPMTIDRMSNLELYHYITPSTSSPVGARGVGEGGGGPIAAIINAVEDALEPLGVKLIMSNVVSEELWKEVNKNDIKG